MNPLKSITGTIVSGIVLALIFIYAVKGFAIMSPQDWTVWFHAVVGVIWIGLLYYFNFVQVPAAANAVAEADSGGPGPAAINKYVAPRALLWFRWAALVTWLSGATYLLHQGTFVGAFTLGIGAEANQYYLASIGFGASRMRTRMLCASP